MAKLYFATLFDINYLNRGLALFASLSDCNISFHLFVLCLDQTSYDFLTQNFHQEVTPVALDELEQFEPQLKVVKSERSKTEYFFTLSPVWPLYLLHTFPHVDQITTLDSDLYFFSDPTPILQEMGDFSVLITPHKFPSKFKYREKWGLYNVSFQSFKRDPIGLRCLEEWKINCLEWCYDGFQNGKFADQKYLDYWQKDYGKVRVIEHKGAGLAPWNISGLNFEFRDQEIWVGDQKLVYYHFHHLRLYNKNWVIHGLDEYEYFPGSFLIKYVYGPYVKKLAACSQSRLFDQDTGRISYTRIGLFKKMVKGGVFWYHNNSITNINPKFYESYLRVKNWYKLNG